MSPILPLKLRRLPSHCLALAALGSMVALTARTACAEPSGVASLGATGGLTIPSAYVLDSGDMALSLGSYLDPRLGSYGRKQNYTLGFGLFPGVEVFGRFAEYTNQRPLPPGSLNVFGLRDISANAKWQLPLDLPGLPKLAVGATDLSGGAVNFSSKYAVASDEYGPLRWSLGYAKGKSAQRRVNGAKVLDGAFGGAEFTLGNTGAALLAETDGTQVHAGLRYYSDRLSWLGDAQVISTLQRSFGATTLAGRAADATSLNVSLVLPLTASERVRKARADATPKPLPPIESSNSGGMVATAEDRIETLARALVASGLDRVRVGVLDHEWVVEYENYRYLHNEADALGIVLGLAAEHAPAGIERVHVVTRKAGLVVLETSVDAAAYRLFLRDGEAARVKESMTFGPPAGHGASAVRWASGVAGAAQRRSWLRVELKPLLNYTLGTEYGAFDYSLAANVRATASLWKGAEVYTDVVQRLKNSDNMEPGRLFADLRHRDGVKTLALQQSFWLGQRLFTSVGVGKYNYTDRGAEGESILFLPWNEDTVHFRGSFQRHQIDILPKFDEAYAALYRWKLNSVTWVEGGYQQYFDRSDGPALTMTRWFGDAAVQVFARKGGNNTFVGVELNLPLTPRQGMKAGPVQLSGSARYGQSIRTLLTNGGNTGNFVRPDAVRSVSLNYKPEIELLNSGRITPQYIQEQAQRMRESFFLYAREQID